MAFASTGASKTLSTSEVDSYLAFGAFEAGPFRASVVEYSICFPQRFVSLRRSRSSNGCT